MTDAEIPSQFIDKCPGNDCDKTIKRNWALGVMPHVMNYVIVVFRCPYCKTIFGIIMQGSQVKDYIMKLKIDKNGGYGFYKPKSHITEEEIKEFSTVLTSNPSEIINKFNIIEQRRQEWGIL